MKSVKPRVTGTYVRDCRMRTESRVWLLCFVGISMCSLHVFMRTMRGVVVGSIDIARRNCENVSKSAVTDACTCGFLIRLFYLMLLVCTTPVGAFSTTTIVKSWSHTTE